MGHDMEAVQHMPRLTRLLGDDYGYGFHMSEQMYFSS